MKKGIYIAALTGLTLLALTPAQGVEIKPDLNELISVSDAICKGTVINLRTFEKSPRNRIFTATGFSVEEEFKGIFSKTVELEHRGGELNGRGETYCGQPIFNSNQRYLLFISRREDGSLFCRHSIAATDPEFAATLDQLQQQAVMPGEEVSDRPSSLVAAALNLLPGSTGYSSRFLAADRGEPIEYVVDMDDWPSGITSNQALIAVSNAFAAWSAETTLTFSFGGVESFDMAAPDYGTSDGRIYIQLHDNYGFIAPSSTLAVGGRSYTYSGAWPDGGLGGRVGTNEFDKTTYGYLVVEHSKTFSTPANFEEVLCHEIGHVLSLGHSSETPGETDPLLADAIMYYQAHFDDRAASLREWDTNTLHVIHPLTDTPPYGYDRIIRAITQPTAPAFSTGINQVQVNAYDLQGGASPILLSENSNESNGSFSLENGNIIFFTPAGYYGDNEASEGLHYALRYARMSDGVNMSPPISIKVLSFNADGNSDLLKDSWATTYGVSGAATDSDNDGLSNYNEWRLDLDPTNPQSRVEISLSGSTLSWNTKAQELYQLRSTTNLLDGFSNAGNPILADSTNETATVLLNDQEFFQIQLIK